MKATPADLPVAFVEIPKGSRNKYEYDARLERLVLDRTLYASVVYPCDYGFLLETLGEDGDPLDVLLLVTSPTFPGCLVPCRPVGVLEMHDEAGQDEKILCVPHSDPTWTRVADAEGLASPCAALTSAMASATCRASSDPGGNSAPSRCQ